MKRKRLILATVLLAGVASVVVPMRREIWWAVAYERKSFGDYQPSVLGLHFHEKRAEWLPGRRFVVPGQECASCRGQRHGTCVSGSPFYYAGETLMEQGYLEILIYDGVYGLSDGVTLEHWVAPAGGAPTRTNLVREETWRCTCPDPSHAWNR